MELRMQERGKLTMVKAQTYLKAGKARKSEVLDDFCEGAGYCRRHVARALQQTAQELVEFPLSSLVLSGVPKDWPAVVAAVEQGQVRLQPPPASTM